MQGRVARACRFTIAIALSGQPVAHTPQPRHSSSSRRSARSSPFPSQAPGPEGAAPHADAAARAGIVVEDGQVAAGRIDVGGAQPLAGEERVAAVGAAAADPGGGRRVGVVGGAHETGPVRLVQDLDPALA